MPEEFDPDGNPYVPSFFDPTTDAGLGLAQELNTFTPRQREQMLEQAGVQPAQQYGRNDINAPEMLPGFDPSLSAGTGESGGYGDVAGLREAARREQNRFAQPEYYDLGAGGTMGGRVPDSNTLFFRQQSPYSNYDPAGFRVLQPGEDRDEIANQYRRQGYDVSDRPFGRERASDVVGRKLPWQGVTQQGNIYDQVAQEQEALAAANPLDTLGRMNQMLNQTQLNHSERMELQRLDNSMSQIAQAHAARQLSDVDAARAMSVPMRRAEQLRHRQTEANNLIKKIQEAEEFNQVVKQKAMQLKGMDLDAKTAQSRVVPIKLSDGTTADYYMQPDGKLFALGPKAAAGAGAGKAGAKDPNAPMGFDRVAAIKQIEPYVRYTLGVSPKNADGSENQKYHDAISAEIRKQEQGHNEGEQRKAQARGSQVGPPAPPAPEPQKVVDTAQTYLEDVLKRSKGGPGGDTVPLAAYTLLKFLKERGGNTTNLSADEQQWVANQFRIIEEYEKSQPSRTAGK